MPLENKAPKRVENDILVMITLNTNEERRATAEELQKEDQQSGNHVRRDSLLERKFKKTRKSLPSATASVIMGGRRDGAGTRRTTEATADQIMSCLT